MRDWFDLTHEVQGVGFGGAVCRMVRLPGPGGIGDQDAWLMEGLEVVRDTVTSILGEQAALSRA